MLFSLRLLPLVELRLIKGGECRVPFCWDIPSESAVDVVLVCIALTSFLRVANV